MTCNPVVLVEEKVLDRGEAGLGLHPLVAGHEVGGFVRARAF